MKKIVEEKIKELKEMSKTGIDEVVRLGQIAILQDVLLENFKKEIK